MVKITAFGIIAIALVAFSPGALAAPGDLVTNSIGLELSPIPAGSFVMGQDEGGDWDEVPAHQVTIRRPFRISTTEVSLEQYHRFRPQHRASLNGKATGVSWYEAVAFCEWLSNKEGQPYRMPTEAEWEYTCRAGTATKFWSGNKPPPDAQAANSWGLKAMHDSVLEWGSDWHEVPPTADEPVTFRGQRGGGAVTNLANLNTVQGQLTEAQYKDLLTPGAELHQRWCAQVDAIVPFLKKLEEARVPLLWRPFHKMNGTWFWWGGRRGEYGTAAKYKMMFDRLVKHHKIKNLIWGWSVDRPEGTSLKFEECWPGPEYVDVLSLDCYREFKQPYYNDLLKVANGKPIALGEVGGNLSLAALQSQPKWT